MKSVAAFLSVIGHDWAGLMSGGIGLVLTVLSFYGPSSWQPKGFLFLGVLCLFYVSYRAWSAERRQCEALLEEREPRLQFIRDPSVKPYFEEMPLAVHFEHELQPMGKPAGMLVVGIPAYGTVAVDVAHEVVGPGEERGELHLCYAQLAAPALPANGGDTYNLVLRAEGGPAPSHAVRIIASWRERSTPILG